MNEPEHLNPPPFPEFSWMELLEREMKACKQDIIDHLYAPHPFRKIIDDQVKAAKAVYETKPWYWKAWKHVGYRVFKIGNRAGYALHGWLSKDGRYCDHDTGWY